MSIKRKDDKPANQNIVKEGSVISMTFD
jgi:hypothetical protein